MPRAPRPGPRPTRRSPKPRPGPDPRPAQPAPEARVARPEDPHAHIVCRVCGRIQRLDLTELDRHLLGELADRRPVGWSFDGVAYSLTGACRRCREGPGTA